MKKIASALLCALLLAGCAAPAEEASPAPVSRTAPAPAAQADHMSSSLVESSARPMPEAEVLAAYERAQRVYGWFDLAPLPTSGESVSVNGAAYYRVDMEGMEELEDLRACLRGVFSQELTDRLLDGRSARIQYRDVNGVLFAAGESRDPDSGKGQARVEVEQTEEAVCFVNVTVDLLGEDRETVVGLESWSFPYAFVDDRWVFTDFRLVS
nr:hypothetical protein [uncultured Oscillibacter sp.]